MEFSSIFLVAIGLGIAGLVKGVTGMGLPLIGVTLLATFFTVPHAIAILVVPTLVTNIWQLWSFRHSWRRGRMPFLLPMLIFGAAGICVGTWLLVKIDDQVLKIALAIMLLAYIALRLTRPSFSIGERVGRLLSAPIGFAAGVIAGATGVSAPIGVTFIHAMRFERTAHVFAVSALFTMFVLAQIPALMVAGVLTPGRWLESVFALLPVAVAMPAGNWIGERVNQTTFDRVIIVLLVVTAVRLIIDSL